MNIFTPKDNTYQYKYDNKYHINNYHKELRIYFVPTLKLLINMYLTI